MERRSAATLLSAWTIVLAGCGGEKSGTSAASATTGPATPTMTTAARPRPAREYVSKRFLAGRLRATLPRGWKVTEDSPGELRFARLGDAGHGVLLWHDVYPVQDGERVEGVPPTAAGLVDWLRRSLDLDLTEPRRGSLASGLPATVMDMSVSAEATNDDRACRARLCVSPFGSRHWDAPYGIAGDAVTRLLLADVRYGGAGHLLVAAIEGKNRADLEARLPAAGRLLRTVRLS